MLLTINLLQIVIEMIKQMNQTNLMNVNLLRTMFGMACMLDPSNVSLVASIISFNFLVDMLLITTCFNQINKFIYNVHFKSKYKKNKIIK